VSTSRCVRGPLGLLTEGDAPSNLLGEHTWIDRLWQVQIQTSGVRRTVATTSHNCSGSMGLSSLRANGAAASLAS